MIGLFNCLWLVFRKDLPNELKKKINSAKGFLLTLYQLLVSTLAWVGMQLQCWVIWPLINTPHSRATAKQTLIVINTLTIPADTTTAALAVATGGWIGVEGYGVQ